MFKTLLRSVMRSLFALFLLVCFGYASAQTYPQRPVRMVVAVAAGGSTDVMGRLIAAKLGERIGQQVVVDNRPGGSSMVGSEIVAKAQPDGHTLLMASASFGTMSSMFAKLPFDLERDFAPVSLLATSPYVLVVQPSLPIKSVTDLIAYGKANPGKLNYAGSTPGSLQRLAGELLKRTAGFDMTYVPYKGTGQLMPDLLGGRLQVAFDNVLILTPYIRSNTLRGIGVTSAKRSALFPELPTIAETGVPGFHAVGWFGIFSTGKTPQPVVDKLNAALVAIMKDPDMRERLIKQGAEPLGGTPGELRQYLAGEIAKWGKVIREAGIKVD
jgi:tripartite-type tricarboxylate transporter receptor subunit TctC